MDCLGLTLGDVTSNRSLIRGYVKRIRVLNLADQVLCRWKTSSQVCDNTVDPSNKDITSVKKFCPY